MTEEKKTPTPKPVIEDVTVKPVAEPVAEEPVTE
jgi:hypothetical protein